MSEVCAEAATGHPAASDVFLRHLTNEVNKEDVYKMIDVQQHMLSRFEKTNEMLLNFNGLSNTRCETTQRDFRRHIQLLVDTKKDLDSVFRRIRVIKSKLSLQYPKAFAACAQVYQVPDDEDDFDPEGNAVRSVEEESVSSSQTSSTIQVKIEDDASVDHTNGQTLSSSQLATSESLNGLTKPLMQPAA